MKEQKKKTSYQEAFNKFAFPSTIAAAIFMAMLAKGVVFNGMFMGIVITVAMWILVKKLPYWLQCLMGRHQLLSDLVLTILIFSGLASMGPGPTILMASTTQATMTSVLLKTLPTK